MDYTLEKIKEAREERDFVGKPKKAIAILEDLGDKVKDDPLLSYDYPKILKKLAICYSDIGETQRAREYFLEALERAKEDINEIETADVRTQLAFLELRTGNIDKSFEYAQESWKYIGKKRGDRFTKTKTDTALLLGNIYFEQSLYKKAMKNYKNSLKQAKSVDYKDGIFEVIIEMANYHIVHEDFDTAIELIEEYLEAADKHVIIRAKMEMQLGKAYVEKTDLKKAKELGLEAHRIFHKGKILRSLAECCRLLGTAYAPTNQKKADSYFKTAFDIYNDTEFVVPKEHPQEKDWYTDFEDM